MENRSIVVPTLWLLLRHHFFAILHSIASKNGPKNSGILYRKSDVKIENHPPKSINFVACKLICFASFPNTT